MKKTFKSGSIVISNAIRRLTRWENTRVTPDQTRLALSELFAEQLGLPRPSDPFGYERFCELVDIVLEESGLKASSRTADPDSRVVKTFLFMAKRSYHRLLHPPPAPCEAILARVSESRQTAPKTTGDLAQSRCDSASLCRRASTIRQHLDTGSSILLLGDDDGLSPLLVGEYDVTVIDVDPRVVEWVASFGVQATVQDVRKLPKEFAKKFSAVAADPIRGLEAGWFLDAAQRCLRPRGLYFWADHPDWNYAFEALHFEVETSMEMIDVLEDWHRYPASMTTEGNEYSQLGPEHQRFLKLGELISLWSHLYVLRCSST